MTSNVGTRQIEGFARGVGFKVDAILKLILNMPKGVAKALNRTFAPEFINRVDDIIMFDQLDKEAINKIIDLELSGLFKRVTNLGYTIKLSDEAKDFIADKGYDVQYGARPSSEPSNAISKTNWQMLFYRVMREGDTILMEMNETKDGVKAKIIQAHR